MPLVILLYCIVSGVVYMKNTVVQYWDEMYRRKNAFIINDRDKQIVRENIVQAILTASNLIRYSRNLILHSVPHAPSDLHVNTSVYRK